MKTETKHLALFTPSPFLRLKFSWSHSDIQCGELSPWSSAELLPGRKIWPLGDATPIWERVLRRIAWCAEKEFAPGSLETKRDFFLFVLETSSLIPKSCCMVYCGSNFMSLIFGWVGEMRTPSLLILPSHKTLVKVRKIFY